MGMSSFDMPICLASSRLQDCLLRRHCEARSNLTHCVFNILPRRQPRKNNRRVLRTRWGDCFVVPPTNDEFLHITDT